MIWGPNPNVAKTFILQFIYKGGNGWAFVNAPTINKQRNLTSWQVNKQ